MIEFVYQSEKTKQKNFTVIFIVSIQSFGFFLLRTIYTHNHHHPRTRNHNNQPAKQQQQQKQEKFFACFQ